MTRQRVKEEQHALFLRLTHRCRWGTCTENFEGLHLSKIRAHLGKHLGGHQKECLWRASDEVTSCNQKPQDFFHHLKQVHGLPVRQVDAENQVFCHPCSKFVAGGMHWTQHCDWHLSRLDSLDCDQVTFRGLVLRTRLCPFCVGDHALKPEKRWAQLTDNSTVRRRHIEQHVAKLSNWPQKCPHPRCSAALRSAQELLSHCYEMHLPDCNSLPKESKETCREESSKD